MQLCKDRVTARRDAHLMKEQRPRIAAHGTGHMSQPRAEALRTAGMRRSNTS
jgi:hypothetical protein